MGHLWRDETIGCEKNRSRRCAEQETVLHHAVLGGGERTFSLDETEAAYGLNWISFPERNQRFVTSLVQLRVLVMFSVKLSLSSFVQYNSAANLVFANVRLRYNPREGNDFYVVYNAFNRYGFDEQMPNRIYAYNNRISGDRSIWNGEA
ncbi:MAG: hypothetical protein E2P02_21005 [Acidobacteria bacterium]|nr:MAG: hypothetical protein E2P02_21005 [Acidobacteriota bacterium]